MILIKQFIVNIKYNDRYNLLLIICILILIIIIYNLFRTNDHFISNDGDHIKIKSVLGGQSGFYSQLLISLNRYIYAKKHAYDFEIIADGWAYTLDKGWLDYFDNINIITGSENVYDTIIEPSTFEMLGEFTTADYRAELPHFYKLNDNTNALINKQINDIGFGECASMEYGAIYIRRGDKLVNEISLIAAHIFLNKLLGVYPQCNMVFLQTDDYTCYIELEQYINENNLAIKLATLCPNTNFGAISNKTWADQVAKSDNKYLQNVSIGQNIADMNADMKLAHTCELLASVKLCCAAKYTICDFRSNVARFIKLAHNNIDNVINVEGDNEQLPLNKIIVPFLTL